MKQFYRLAALFLALLLLCGCAAGNGYGKPERKAGQDEYLTDPVPEGKPQPVEPQDVTVGDTEYTCTISISCASILEHMDLCDKEKVELVPEDGWLLKPVEVTFKQGQSVFDVLQQVCKDNKLHMEFSMTPIYNSAYIEGIGNLYEFDCGEVSGWMYKVNDWFPNYGCSRYQLQNGDIVEWEYTCELGKDIGMQAAAMNPSFLDKSDVDEATLAKEKEILLAQMANDPKNANKPDAVKQKMIEGKIKKFFKENCLVDQEFVKDSDLSVAQYTAKVAKDLGGDIKIVKFTRFQKGEGLEKRADDFAAEVASMVK